MTESLHDRDRSGKVGVSDQVQAVGIAFNEFDRTFAAAPPWVQADTLTLRQIAPGLTNRRRLTISANARNIGISTMLYQLGKTSR